MWSEMLARGGVAKTTPRCIVEVLWEKGGNLRFVRRAVCADCACDDLGYISGENMDGLSVFK